MLTRKPMKRSRPKPALPPALRAKLAERSNWVCEAGLPMCAGWATDACHRKAAQAGGRPLGDDIRLSNFWHGCRACHSWTHARPIEAGDLGLMLEQHRDPLVEPMAYRDVGWVLLDDEGGLQPAEAPERAA